MHFLFAANVFFVFGFWFVESILRFTLHKLYVVSGQFLSGWRRGPG